MLSGKEPNKVVSGIQSLTLPHNMGSAVNPNALYEGYVLSYA